MKILFKGNVFNPTGIATANREMVKALLKKGVSVQCTDPYHDKWEFSQGLENVNDAINVHGDETLTIFADYPQHWRDGYGQIVGHFLHEGTRLHQGWPEMINQVERIWVPSEANKKMFRWNGVTIPIEVIPYGTNPEVYKPKELPGNEDFLFLSVNSWSGIIGDRKGTDMLIKAFDEEFKPEEKVKLILKIGTFWQGETNYMEAIMNVLGHENKNIIYNDKYVLEEELAEHYQQSDCFVSPTRGEGFGLTILNAMACGLPVIVTKDRNAGHMDFCKDVDSVLWIDTNEPTQGDPRFYAKGNLLANPDLESLKKQMRYAFENGKELREKAIANSTDIRENWSWERTAEKLIKYLKEDDGEGKS